MSDIWGDEPAVSTPQFMEAGTMDSAADSDWGDETEPVEHYDIRSTPVDMPNAPRGSGRTPKLQKDLEAFYQVIGTGLFPFDNQTGVVILESAPNCAEALYDLSQKNPGVKRALQNIMSAGTYGAVISAHLPIAVMIATKYIPPVRDHYGSIVKDFMESNKA